jgi:proline iminopeptidase
MVYKLPLLLFFAVALFSCERSDELNRLVPVTVAENPDLPSLSIHVAGRERLIHYRAFGNPDHPVLFILHGSVSDSRVYLPLQIFSDKYYVVLWDMRGNGLSERCTADELSIDEMVNEIEVVKQHFSPDRPVTLMGHSWTAFFVALHLARYPNSTRQAILLEPNALKDEYLQEIGGALNLFTVGYMDMMYTNKYLTTQDHEMLDYQALNMLPSAVRNFYCDPENLPDWPVWRVGALALMVWEKSILTNGKFDFDYTEGLDAYPKHLLIVGTECSPIGYDFQEKYHLPLFQDAEVLRIEDSGHRLITEQFEALVAGLKAYLSEYK